MTDRILIPDFGSQVTQPIVCRVRLAAVATLLGNADAEIQRS